MREWQVLLMAKFPAFDSGWSKEAQLVWFDAFLWLMDATAEWRKR